MQVEAKKAVPRDEQQSSNGVGGGVGRNNASAGLNPIAIARTKKIFVGGLAATVTEHEFRKYFDQFGTTSDVVVMYDHATQRPRGFGFITYDSEDAVDRVLQKSFHELKGKMVEVKRAIPKEMSPSPARGNGGAGAGVASFGYGHFNPSPIGPFPSRIDGRYNNSPSPGPAFSPYAAAGYGTNNTRSSFISSMNAGYNGGIYGGANAHFGRSFGPGPSSNAAFGGGGYGPSSASYGSTPGRSLWSTGPMAYGNNSLVSGYGYNRGSSIGAYNAGGLGSWSPSHNPNSNGGYAAGNANYGSHDGASYRSNNVGYNGRGNGYGSPLGMYSSVSSPNSVGGGGAGGTYDNNFNREMYNSFGFSRERPQKMSIGTDPFSPSATIGGSGFRGYGSSDNGNEFAGGAYMSSAYGSARQSHRG
jgi:RNA-binding protein Musashi